MSLVGGSRGAGIKHNAVFGPLKGGEFIARLGPVHSCTPFTPAGTHGKVDTEHVVPFSMPGRRRNTAEQLTVAGSHFFVLDVEQTPIMTDHDGHGIIVIVPPVDPIRKPPTIAGEEGCRRLS